MPDLGVSDGGEPSLWPVRSRSSLPVVVVAWGQGVARVLSSFLPC